MTVSSATVDQAIANPVVPNPMASMGNLLQAAGAVQQYQANAIGLKQKQQAWQEQQNVMQAVQNDPAFKARPDGTFDTAAITDRLSQIAPMTGREVAQQFIGHNDTATTANNKIMANSSDQILTAGKFFASNVNQPISNILKAAEDFKKEHADTPQIGTIVDQCIQGLLNDDRLDISDQDQLNAALGHIGSRANTLAEIKDTFGADYQGISAGGSTKLGQKNPFAPGGAVSPASPNAPSITNTLAPQVVMDANGQPHFVGGGAGTGSGAWPSRPQVEATSAATADMSNHFTGLNASSQSLPLVTSLTKTIEGLAPEAFTGVGGDKKQYMSGLAKVFHIDLTGDAQTDTNLLNKAMAQLNISTPAGTDAARALVEAGQPNSKMDPAAIKEAAGTIAAQVKMSLAERNFLQTTRYSNRGAGDPWAYQQGRQAFESNADPRIWQYEEMAKTNLDAANAFLRRQPDAADLIKKAGNLEGMGFFK